MNERYLEAECHNCHSQVLVPIRERPGDVAIDKLKRIDSMLDLPYHRSVSGPAAVRMLEQVYKIIHGWA